jgi:DNA-binding transcriptional LysR family regulator
MNWDDVRFFLEAQRRGSLVGAARSLQVEASTVSRRVARLERDLGGALFLRTPEGLLPTELCQQVLPWAQEAERSLSLMRASPQGDAQARGVVRLAVTEAIAHALIFPHLADFQRRHRGLHLEVLTGYQLVDLSRREADLALRFVRAGHADLISRHLLRFASAPYLHRDLLARLQREASGRPLRVSGLPWVGLEASFSQDPETRWLREHVPVEPVLRVTAYTSMLHAARQGVGATLLSCAYAQLYPELVPVPLELPPGPELNLFLVTHRALRHTPWVSLVWDWLLELAQQVEQPVQA